MYEDPTNNQQAYNAADENNYYAQDAALEARKSSGTWKGVLIGGFPGIALGAAGAFLASSNILRAEEPDDTGLDASKSIPIYSEAPLSESVNDDMSFAEAFGAARDEVGAGGIFVWHGQVYSTYTSEEWNNLSPDQQTAYAQSIIGVTNGEDPNTEVLDGEESNLDNPGEDVNGEEVTGEESNLDNPGEESNLDNPGEESNLDNPGEEPGGENPGVEDPGVEDPQEVDILGSDIVIAEIGQYEQADGSVGVAAVGTVDGMDAVFYDVDADGIVDGVQVDIDGDGQIAENEVVNLEDSGLTISDLSVTDNSEGLDNVYADNTDYSNDYTNDDSVSMV